MANTAAYADPKLQTEIDALKPFIAELFRVFVDEPIQPKQQAILAASRIACAVCDAEVSAAHLAYSDIVKARTAAGQITGSSTL
jgi:hypothetical protein